VRRNLVDYGAMVRLLSWLMVAVLVHAVVPSHDATEHAPIESVAAHSAPCPDATPEGDPCSDDCVCLCCPGHARVLPVGTQVALASLIGVQELPDPVGNLNPIDLVTRVFRPPRSA